MQDIITSDNFALGVIAGMVILGLAQMFVGHSYRWVLLGCARAESAERLPDGKFYYIVPESEYVPMKVALHSRQAQEQAAGFPHDPSTPAS